VELTVEGPQWYSNSRLASDINEVFNMARIYVKKCVCFTGARLSSLVNSSSTTMTPVPKEFVYVLFSIIATRNLLEWCKPLYKNKICRTTMIPHFRLHILKFFSLFQAEYQGQMVNISLCSRSHGFKSRSEHRLHWGSSWLFSAFYDEMSE
jgi:hypothetical protein